MIHKVSGADFSGHNLQVIKAKIWAHEKANEYPVSTDKEIEDQLCANHPDSCEEPRKYVPRGVQLRLSDIMRGTLVIANFKLSGGKLVSHEEADRRAGICVTCPRNVDFIKPCTGWCKQLVDLVQSMIGGAKTKFDDRLKACEICHCDNHAQVHVPADILAKGVTPGMMAEFRAIDWCWKWKSIDGAPP